MMDSGLGHKFDPELLPAILNTIYNGDYFIEEEDGKEPGRRTGQDQHQDR